MIDHDAVLAVGIHRFAVRRTQQGQRVTMRAAEKIAAMAKAIGIDAQRTPAEMGFESDLTWSVDAMWQAMRQVEESGGLGLLRELDMLLAGLSAEDVEQRSTTDNPATGRQFRGRR